MRCEGYGPTMTMTFIFFNDTATTEIYTLSLHDALPIYADRLLVGPRRRPGHLAHARRRRRSGGRRRPARRAGIADRKSTRLNSSHANISYAVFCLKKKIRQRSLISIAVCIFW